MIALTGARVITVDPGRRVLDNATVLIRGSRIEAIGAAVDIPKGEDIRLARTHDNAWIGRCPCASEGPTSPFKKMPPLGVIEQRVSELRANLASGVTTLYEVYGTVDKDFWLSDMLLEGSMVMKDLIERGAMTGPRMFVAGCALPISTRPAQADGQDRDPCRVDGVAEVQRVARQQLGAGADWIKMFGSTGSGQDTSAFPTISPTALNSAGMTPAQALDVATSSARHSSENPESWAPSSPVHSLMSEQATTGIWHSRHYAERKANKPSLRVDLPRAVSDFPSNHSGARENRLAMSILNLCHRDGIAFVHKPEPCIRSVGR